MLLVLNVVVPRCMRPLEGTNIQDAAHSRLTGLLIEGFPNEHT
jgi:hypothetical protein